MGSPYVTLEYKVRKGETLSAVARTHGVSVEELRRQNGLSRDAKLRSGQSLKISRSQDSEPAVSGKLRTAPGPRATFASTKRYIVKRGDTLQEIARVHGVSMEDLRRWNGLSQDTSLRPGQELRTSDSSS